MVECDAKSARFKSYMAPIRTASDPPARSQYSEPGSNTRTLVLSRITAHKSVAAGGSTLSVRNPSNEAVVTCVMATCRPPPHPPPKRLRCPPKNEQLHPLVNAPQSDFTLVSSHQPHSRCRPTMPKSMREEQGNGCMQLWADLTCQTDRGSPRCREEPAHVPLN